MQQVSDQRVGVKGLYYFLSLTVYINWGGRVQYCHVHSPPTEVLGGRECPRREEEEDRAAMFSRVSTELVFTTIPAHLPCTSPSGQTGDHNGGGYRNVTCYTVGMLQQIWTIEVFIDRQHDTYVQYIKII